MSDKTKIKCDACDGEGKLQHNLKDEGKYPCGKCDGEGEIESPISDKTSAETQKREQEEDVEKLANEYINSDKISSNKKWNTKQFFDNDLYGIDLKGRGEYLYKKLLLKLKSETSFGFRDGYKAATSILTERISQLEKEITRLQEKYDESGFDCSPLIKLQRIEQHVDAAIDMFSKENERLKDFTYHKAYCEKVESNQDEEFINPDKKCTCGLNTK